jgi:Vitamin K-dependent gamma-carboxylase
MTTAAAGTVPPAARGVVGRVLQGWDRFWFRPCDPTTLGLVRVCTGVIVLFVHLVYTFELQDLMGEHAWVSRATMERWRHEMPFFALPAGWAPEAPAPPLPATMEERARVAHYRDEWAGTDPRTAWARGLPIWSVWFHVTDPASMLAVHALILASMFLFTIGFCTRLTAVLSWAGAICYVQRATTSVFGMDTMMIVLLLYLMIGPSGAALSVDRLLARWWARRQAARSGKPAPQLRPPEPSAAANFALRLIQIHFCIIYLGSGLPKLQGAAWWNGVAMWWTVVNADFAPTHLPSYVALLEFLCHHRLLWELAMSGGTALTLAVEIGFPFLVWFPRLRPWVIILAVLLHVGIVLVLGLASFSGVMLAMLLAFFPSPAVARFLGVQRTPAPPPQDAARSDPAPSGDGAPVLPEPAGEGVAV